MKLRLRLFLAAVLLVPAVLPALTLEELAAQPELWPAQVTIKGATKATVLKNGQPAGMMLLGADRKLTVTGVTAQGVTGRAGDATVLVPADKTDIFWQVGKAHPEQATEKQPAAAQALASLKTAGEKTTGPLTPAAAPVTAPIAPVGAGGITPIQRLLAGRMVRLEGGALKTFDARQLNGVKYYGIMFSAGWCGPCRQFAPVLLQQYALLKKAYPEFELVFYSWDRSAGDMKDYMSEENMPWPALKFAGREDIAEIARLAGPGIPCLVLIDADGRVLAHSFKGDDYLGPGVPLEKAWEVLRRDHGQ